MEAKKMGEKKIVLVAGDIAPSSAFAMVAEKLGEDAISLLGMGKPPEFSLDDVKLAVQQASVVLVGMSSSSELAEPEIAACDETVKTDVPFGFYGDTYHCYKRARHGAWFGPYRKDVSFFFAINKEEAKAAKDIFVKAEVVATGNPLWEKFAFPELSRTEARKSLGIADHEIFVLSPGTKSPAVTALVWGTLLDALGRLPEDKNFYVVLSCHPGDRAPHAIDPVDQKQVDIYGDFLKFSPVPVRILGGDIKTSRVLPGADVLVEWGTTIAIEAAHLRIPVISISTEIGRKRMLSTSGTEEWELCKVGVALPAYGSPQELAKMLMALLSPGKAVGLKQRQAEVYPKPPEKGTAVKKMIESLQKFAA